MRKLLNLSIIGLLLLTAFACKENGEKTKAHQNNATVNETVKQHKKDDDCKDVHWSHHPGEHGPENWQNLCSGFSACGGKHQSPIDIDTQTVIKDSTLKAPVFHYQTSPVDIVNNGHTVQFNIQGDNTANLNGKYYKLLQFHYHSLSEHEIDHKHFPLEVHFVHKNTDTDYAVLGVMFKEGKNNLLFDKYLDKFPVKKGEYKAENEQIDLISLLPQNKSYYLYNGSLTTPPCSEVVTWYVLKTPIEASKEQLEKFSKILDNNYRPVMPLNDRKVRLFEDK
jgi:carbonic anhydrase